ncbi:hypothetical protein LQF76_05895 [Gloeomargaritales cyanobacterium VI4D9]|nr:hypothetical protein LQF76_05895 [Gloeomargaritales cyanobacterium VI4D9]
MSAIDWHFLGSDADRLGFVENVLAVAPLVCERGDSLQQAAMANLLIAAHEVIQHRREHSATSATAHPECRTLADMVTPERLEELKQEFEQAVAMGEQVKEWWDSQHRPDPDQQ